MITWTVILTAIPSSLVGWLACREYHDAVFYAAISGLRDTPIGRKAKCWRREIEQRYERRR